MSRFFSVRRCAGADSGSFPAIPENCLFDFTGGLTRGMAAQIARSIRKGRVAPSELPCLPWKSVGTMLVRPGATLECGARKACSRSAGVRFISAFQSHVSFMVGLPLHQEQARCPERPGATLECGARRACSRSAGVRFISAFQSRVSFMVGLSLHQEQARCPEGNNF